MSLEPAVSLKPQVVDLGERSYSIVFGDLEGLGERMATLREPGPCVVVCNPLVEALYGERCLAALQMAGWAPTLLRVPDGEHAKSIAHWASLVQGILRTGADRQTPVVALGGGVTGDLAGFAAASVMRGLPLIQVPTTLLAMVDSSVGGKTAVNLPSGKNLVGAFYQPELVYVDVTLLASLPDAELRCGLGEVIKHALIGGEDFFAELEVLVPALVNREEGALERVVQASCAIKAQVVSEDEKELGRRAILNLGHSIGHAIEQALGYGKIRHGEAVAMGLLAEARWAQSNGICSMELVLRLEKLIHALGLKTQVNCSKDVLMKALYKDKKMCRAKLLVPVAVCVGEIRLDHIDPSTLRSAAESLSGEAK
jgi:3-dehydroquinate synthase